MGRRGASASLWVWFALFQAEGFLLATGVILGVWGLAGFAVRHRFIPDEDTVMAMEGFGAVYRRLFAPDTYYERDTAHMFQETVRKVVQQVIADVRAKQGLRALSDDAFDPVSQPTRR